MDEQSIRYAMQAIVLYLHQNPQSADTLEGVHLWWIRWPNIQESVLVTAEALHRLQTAKQVESRTIGKRELWCLTRTSVDS